MNELNKSVQECLVQIEKSQELANQAIERLGKLFPNKDEYDDRLDYQNPHYKD